MNLASNQNQDVRQEVAEQLCEKKTGYVLLLIRSGRAIIGSSDNDSFGLDDEKPQFSVILPGFYLGKTCITNDQYVAFLNDIAPPSETFRKWIDIDSRACHIRKHDRGYHSIDQYKNHPMACVSWYGAIAFCEWAGLRLPSELEWEYAARGPQGWTFPWGNQWDHRKCQWSKYPDHSKTCDVTAHPSAQSPFGLLNMVGNVWEWTSDLYQKEVYNRYTTGDIAPPSIGISRVIRGGPWPLSVEVPGFRCALRNYFPPLPLSGEGGSRLLQLRGFRCAISCCSQ